MDYKNKYTEETNRKPFCWNEKGEYIQSGSYSDGYVKWLEEQLKLCGVSKSFYCSKDTSHKQGLCDKQCNDCKEWMTGLMNQPPQ